MRKIVFSALVALLFFGTNNLYAQTKSQLQQMYVSYLKAEGYQPSIDSDGDVKFTAEGLSLYIDIDEQLKDPNYFRIALQTSVEYKTKAERLKAFEAANIANRTTRIAKVYITSSNKTAIIAEGFITKADDAKEHLKRMVNAMLVARKTFAENM
ncbi:MAG: YbjN domain-containing protein [Holophagales bacterium]|jgi:hypothetical protein|nr:YbjN domain-containing protein [Holophagales bacterium]